MKKNILIVPIVLASVLTLTAPHKVTAQHVRATVVVPGPPLPPAPPVPVVVAPPVPTVVVHEGYGYDRPHYRYYHRRPRYYYYHHPRAYYGHYYRPHYGYRHDNGYHRGWDRHDHGHGHGRGRGRW
ncbi:hypothetical protein ACTHGU_19420 [Chitinophagaceae bacterium MMS25-I14]